MSSEYLMHVQFMPYVYRERAILAIYLKTFDKNDLTTSITSKGWCKNKTRSICNTSREKREVRFHNFVDLLTQLAIILNLYSTKNWRSLKKTLTVNYLLEIISSEIVFIDFQAFQSILLGLSQIIKK